MIETAQTDLQLSTLLRLADAFAVPPAVLLKKPKVLDLPTLAPGPKKSGDGVRARNNARNTAPRLRSRK